MKRSFLVFALLSCAIAGAVAIPVVVTAQEPTVPAVPAAPEVTFGWILASWLIYAVAGLLAGITTSGEHWDTVKFARSLITAILTGFIALAFHIAPANVETQFGGIVTTLANVIVNTAPGVSLIYLLDKIYRLIMNLKVKIEAARALSTPGPPSPS